MYRIPIRLHTRSAIPGGFIAACLSYAVNKSLIWTLFNCLLGWVYVFYWLFSYTAFDDWVNKFVN